jgi:hypothetical protein
LLHILTLGLCPNQTPSGSLALSLPDAPSVEDLAVYEELSEWVDQEAREGSLGEIIRERSASFELFRSYHAEHATSVVLDGMPFGETLATAAARYGVDGLLLASVVEVESSFNPQAVSYRGAVGLMQVMPTTARVSPELLQEPSYNVNEGARYLRHLLDLFEGDLELALAAYNAGPGNVRRYGGIPPFPETRRYVEKVLDLYIGHHQGLWHESEVGDLLVRG